MTTPRNRQYRFIRYNKMFKWPYEPDKEKIKKIKTPERWNKVATELSDFLESGKELKIAGNTLLMKMKGDYVISDDTRNSDKVRNRERCRYMVIDDVFTDVDEFRRRHKPKDNDKTILVLKVFPTMRTVMASMRKEYGLGYEQRIVDTWNEDRIVGTRPGFYR